jgi:hypothetical protein
VHSTRYALAFMISLLTAFYDVGLPVIISISAYRLCNGDILRCDIETEFFK